MPIVVLWRGEDVKKAVRHAGAKGLFQVAEHVLEESNRIVPHRTGQLMRSGESFVDSDQGISAVSYGSTGGGGAAAYAVAQHEGVDFNHPNGREAKFLEKAVQRVAPEMTTIIHGKVKEVLK